MANADKIKQEPVYLELDKKRQLIYDLNAFVEMEETYGSVDEALNAMDKGSIKAIRFFLWIGFLAEDPTLTLQQVGAMITLDNLVEIGNAITKTMESSLPDKSKQNPNE
jgi:hypothetical protein